MELLKLKPKQIIQVNNTYIKVYIRNETLISKDSTTKDRISNSFSSK